MEKVNRFNLRVYGLVVHQESLLILHEKYAGKKLLKFPGGGVEYGEGIVDALYREFKEELNLEIEEMRHFYTQDFFVASIFNQDEQIQTVYYTVKIKELDSLEIKDEGIEALIWLPQNEWQNHSMPLPVDKIVFEKLKQHYLK